MVSDFLTPYDGNQAYIMSMGKPVVQYTYRMAFTRAAQPASYRTAA